MHKNCFRIYIGYYLDFITVKIIIILNKANLFKAAAKKQQRTKCFAVRESVRKFFIIIAVVLFSYCLQMPFWGVPFP